MRHQYDPTRPTIESWHYKIQVVFNASSMKHQVRRFIYSTTSLVEFILRPCQYDNSYIDGRSQILIHMLSARPSLVVTRPSNITEVDVP